MAKLTVGSYIEHYQILEELGKGGMGVVYKALNVNLDKFVAIKTISLGYSSEEIITNRFRTEARALAKLQNPNIVSIFDLRVDDNQWFIVMEYVDGTTLAQKLREQEALPWQECLSIFKQILSAIGHAHRVGIIHRDIKPNNIMLNLEGVVKITDFGLAKDQRNLSHTQTSSTGGTLYYMSPEQVKGLQFTDNRSDIYSLGLTLYEMLAGKIPFRRDDTDFTIREAIIKRQFPPPTHFNPSIPIGLNGIVMRAIEKRPEDRYQNVDQMLESLEEFERKFDAAAPEKDETTGKYAFSEIDPENFDISYFTDPMVSKPSAQNDTKPSGKHGYSRFAAISFAAGILLALVYFSIRWLLPPTMAELMIISDPREAELIINGRSAGRTPLFRYEVESGPVEIHLEKDAYVALDTVVELKSDTLNFYSFDLLPAGTFEFSFTPADARIWVNGRVLSMGTGSEIILPQGEYDIRVEREGYRSRQDRLRLHHGEYLSRTYELEPAGSKQKKSYTRNLTGSSGVTEQLPHASDSSSFPFHRKELTGAVSIMTAPPGAGVWLDGYRIPSFSSPCIIPALAPGEHALSLEKEGYQLFESAVTISESETTDRKSVV